MGKNAFLVALGIFLSRVFGLIRERVFAFYFGNSDEGDALRAALRIPNILQNLLGEGVLSASFVPVYSHLLGQKKEKEAHAVALLVGGALFIAVSVLSLLGIYFSDYLVQWLVPGFSQDKQELCRFLVCIIFPATAFLVMSAWCLGILNSHKKFFIPYVAPVVWNLAIILTLVIWAHGEDLVQTAKWGAWGVFIGSVLQFLVQLPFVFKYMGLETNFTQEVIKNSNVIFKNFIPAVLSRGVVQISSYIDNVIASYLPSGSISILSYAQTIYMLPISLFSMSVSAAELPYLSEMSDQLKVDKSLLESKMNQSLKRISYFVIPSSVAFIFLGQDIVGLLFQTGRFDASLTYQVWICLALSSLGLFFVTQSRFLNSIFYSLKETKIPFYISLVRLTVGSALTIFLAMGLPKLYTSSFNIGLWGMSFAASLMGFLEYIILKYWLKKKTSAEPHVFGYYCKILVGSLICGLVSYSLSWMLSQGIWGSLVKVLVFGLSYLIFSYLSGEYFLFSRFLKKKQK